eukprot:TRINITY_DN2383_c0_g2_i1.p1 TRINITY_DN2383_c0_g2~~TRINITY_DN2383_c0_g2_i1.p1  ORF type:complete len:150 (+),score=14.61 TRINITY_DN2383_c0_g2_i1:442-891(+)
MGDSTYAGYIIDPIQFIARIPSDMAIPDLRQKLIKIIHTYTLELSLREGCNQILKADCITLMRKLHRQQKTAISVQSVSHCAVCEVAILSGRADAVTAFFCGHMYHSSCLQSQQKQHYDQQAAKGKSDQVYQDFCIHCNRSSRSRSRSQ